MPITNNVFKLNQTYDLIRAGCWITYNSSADSGSLFVWGTNSSGQLGNSSRVSVSSPVQIPGTTWLTVSGNLGNHSLAIKSDTTLWAWGNNDAGQLGDNQGKTGGVGRCKSSPVQIPGTSWCAVSAAAVSSMALKTDCTLYVWGCDTLGGSLGLNAREIDRSEPTQIPGSTWCRASRGICYSLAVKTDNTLWAWGCNAEGYIGDGTCIGKSSPVQIPGTTWCDVTAATCTSYALKTDGTLWAWGNNSVGQMGTNSQSSSGINSPVQVPGATWCKVCASIDNAFGLKTDGTLWAWGCNGNGELGINEGATFRYSSPVQIPGTTWCAIAARIGSGYGIKRDNTLWAWGSGRQTGMYCAGDQSSPIQIPGTTWISVNAGNEYTLARKS